MVTDHKMMTMANDDYCLIDSKVVDMMFDHTMMTMADNRHRMADYGRCRIGQMKMVHTVIDHTIMMTAMVCM